MARAIQTLDKISVLESLKARTIIDLETGCWIWQGAKTVNYPVKTIANRVYLVTRLSLWIFKDLDLNDKKKLACHNDKLCKRTDCWNPEHLYVGTYSDNMQDAINAGSKVGSNMRDKTHCKNGHEFNERNTYIRIGGGRACRECKRLDQAKRRGSSINRKRYRM